MCREMRMVKLKFVPLPEVHRGLSEEWVSCQGHLSVFLGDTFVPLAGL